MARPEPVNILLVDDMPSKLLSYEVILQELGENLIKATSATQALVEVLRNDIAVVLTDVCMPDLDGFEFATMLRQHPRCERTAIIFVSAVHLNDVDHVRGYGTGAVDYVSVPVVPEVLKAKVKIFVELYRKTKQLEQLNNELEMRVAERTGQLERSSAMLRQSEERLRLASSAAGFGTYDYDVAADHVYWSSHLRGLSADNAGAPMPLGALIERVHPDDRASLESCMRDTAASPDGRHEIEFRTIAPNGDTRWVLNRGQKFQQDNENIRVVGTMLDITHRKIAEAHQALLMAELDHRVKNVLANVLAIASLSSKNALSVPSFMQALQGRIQAMATAHDLLRRNNWRGADFQAIADVSLSPFRSTDGNIVIEGAGARLSAKTAQTLALVLHELATNAVKHGALSCASGSVKISCGVIPDTCPAKFRLRWEEMDGPAVEKPGMHGFGLTALRAAANEAGAKAEIAFEQGGLVYVLEAPTSADDDRNADDAHEPAGAAPLAPPAEGLRPVRILVVEDEALVALELQAVLEADGHEVIGPAGSVARGLDLARQQAPDLAFLDINLGCETSLPIARELKGLQIPFVFITGYSDPAAVLEDLSGVHRIQKPHSVAALRNAISVCLRKAPSEMKASA